VLVLDAFTPSREYALLQAHPVNPSVPCSASFSPDARALSVGGADGHVYSYDISSWRQQWEKTGIDSDDTLPPLQYLPKRWEPRFDIVGEAYKSPENRSKSRADGPSHLPRVFEAMAQQQAAAPRHAQHSVAVPSVPAAQARSPEELVSRHESPVRLVRWHPRNCVLASASTGVALWTVPTAFVEQ
jgi:hypothetical protein